MRRYINLERAETALRDKGIPSPTADPKDRFGQVRDKPRPAVNWD